LIVACVTAQLDAPGVSVQLALMVTRAVDVEVVETGTVGSGAVDVGPGAGIVEVVVVDAGDDPSSHCATPP
jgi:hypothetical protein